MKNSNEKREKTTKKNVALKDANNFQLQGQLWQREARKKTAIDGGIE